jgi:hypothetical protein
MLEDFRKLELVRHGSRQTAGSRWRQDKGHRAEWEAFAASLRLGKDAPIPFEEIAAVTLATLRSLESRRRGEPMPVNTAEFIASALHSDPPG